ncbi:MAG: hypothetical protein LUD16_08045 [Lachnospiraceae bacterium]|nr:hypothetical protein [Lachnospiraceae bacterium]
MKKRMYLWICAVCAGLMLSGFQAAAAEVQTTEAVLAEDSEGEASAKEGSEDDEFLQELVEPNLLDELAAQYGRVSLTLTVFYTDGTESDWTIYQDNTYYVSEDEYGIMVDEGGDVYGIDYETEETYRYLFVGDAYESFREEMELPSCYAYSENEQIVSREVSDGMIYLETVLYYADAPVYLENRAQFGFEESELVYELTEFVIDEETNEILTVNSYAVSNEEMTLFMTTTLNREPEEYVPDEELTGAVSGEDVSLSVVTDAGTDEEAVYTQTMSEGGTIIIQCGNEFDAYYYADPDCTEVLESIAGYDTVYLKRVDEE